jgi:hypothetical protein
MKMIFYAVVLMAVLATAMPDVDPPSTPLTAPHNDDADDGSNLEGGIFDLEDNGYYTHTQLATRGTTPPANPANCDAVTADLETAKSVCDAALSASAEEFATLRTAKGVCDAALSASADEFATLKTAKGVCDAALSAAPSADEFATLKTAKGVCDAALSAAPYAEELATLTTEVNRLKTHLQITCKLKYCRKKNPSDPTSCENACDNTWA